MQGSIGRGGRFTCDDAIEHVGFGRYQRRLLFVTGALFAGDAMVMMLVSFLMPAARCGFDLTVAEGALIASIVFVGMFCGSYLCGVMADKLGRRVVFLGSAACLAGSSIFSALSVSYYMLLLGQVSLDTPPRPCGTTKGVGSVLGLSVFALGRSQLVCG